MPGGAWQNRVTFVADQADDPVGDFHAMSDNIRLNTLPGTVESRTIYWEKDYIYANPGQGTPDMNTAIKAALGDSVMVQWFGHASRFRWGSTQVFSNFSLIPMSKTASLPMTVDYSCWPGYFINLFDSSGDSRSLSEAFVLTPDRGSVGTVGPCGQCAAGTEPGTGQVRVQRRDPAGRSRARCGPAALPCQLRCMAGCGGYYGVIR